MKVSLVFDHLLFGRLNLSSCPVQGTADPWTSEFRKRGLHVQENTVTSDCDFIICGSHTQVNQLESLHNQCPHIPIINYCWDLYEWIWKDSIAHNGFALGHDWRKYGEYLQKSAEIWCPSNEVVLRIEEYFGIGKKCKVIKTFAFNLFEHNDVQDKRYILQPMRYYTLDRNYGWLKRGCQELSIPLKESLHSLSKPDFENLIAHCSFLVCEYYEASTGGLTLLEGYRLGKPVLVSDSPYMGARDYFGDRATYFNHTDFNAFKHTLKDMWENTPILNREDCVSYIDKFQLPVMVDEMINRLEKCEE